MRPNRVGLRPLRRAVALPFREDIYGDDDGGDSDDSSYDYDEPKPSENFARVARNSAVTFPFSEMVRKVVGLGDNPFK